MEEMPGYGRSGRSASPGRRRSRKPALSVQRPLLSHQGELRCVHETKPPSAESDLGNLDNSVIRFTPIGSEGWVAIGGVILGMTPAATTQLAQQRQTRKESPTLPASHQATKARAPTKLHAVILGSHHGHGVLVQTQRGGLGMGGP